VCEPVALSVDALRMRRSGGAAFLRLGVLCAILLVLAGGLPGRAAAATSLTVTSITWNVLGLDSNKTTTGPNQFPVGVRVCNTGSSAATNTSASFVWDTANAYVSLLESPSQSLGTIAAGSCADAYWTAVVTRDSAAYNTARGYHVSVSADLTATVSTPTPRELFVEKLVSQNRNSILSITGPATVRQGSRVTYVVNSKTATGGYEQLESTALFPTSIFRIVSTSVTYTAPSGATNDKVYADACGWDNVPTSGTYRSCIGPANYGSGKAGGTLATTYVLDVVGSGSASIHTVIYDFSGSSYHYNTDFDTTVTSLTATPNNPPLAVDDSASTSPSTPVTVSVLANDSDADGDTLTITGSSTPAHGTASCTTTCTYTPASGFTGSDSFTYTISDGYGGTATATVNVTVATVVPAFGVDSPLPVVILTVGLALVVTRRRKRV
jgi:hypothetical protein